MTTPTTPIDAQMPPLPDHNRSWVNGEDEKGQPTYGLAHSDASMHAYAQAHAAQRCAELERRVAGLATVIYEHLQLINDAANTLSQNGWSLTADALFTSSKAIEVATKEHQ